MCFLNRPQDFQMDNKASCVLMTWYALTQPLWPEAHHSHNVCISNEVMNLITHCSLLLNCYLPQNVTLELLWWSVLKVFPHAILWIFALAIAIHIFFTLAGVIYFEITRGKDKIKWLAEYISPPYPRFHFLWFQLSINWGLETGKFQK